MKLRKKDFEVPKNFFVPRWEIHLSSVAIPPFPRGVTP